MRSKHLYLLLCVVGLVLPYLALAPFISAHGLDLPLLFSQLFATPAGGFFGLDVIVSSVVLWTFMLIERRRHGLRGLWAPFVANLVVGVSLGLPLFLYLREVQLHGRVHPQA